MEQMLPIIAKKLLKIVKVLYFMLRKGISKPKLLSDLNKMMKRGKIAGKAAMHTLMFHHHHGGSASARHHFAGAPSNDLYYEFSCSKHSRPPPPTGEELMAAAVEMFGSAAVEMFGSAAASPVLPGFGPSPMVRKLRVSDSPFPLRDFEEDNHVDEAAEEFIMRFYKDLRLQNSMHGLFGSI